MRRDTAGSEGISSLIIFVVLILVASVISAVIIATGEKLMQASQSDADDTDDGVYGKIIIIDMIVIDITYDANNDPTAATMLITFEMAPGAPTVSDTDALWMIVCENAATPTFTRWEDSGDFDTATNATGNGNDVAAITDLETGVTYMLQISVVTPNGCAPVYGESHSLIFGFRGGGGVSAWTLTYDQTVRVGDRLI